MQDCILWSYVKFFFFFFIISSSHNFVTATRPIVSISSSMVVYVFSNFTVYLHIDILADNEECTRFP